MPAALPAGDMFTPMSSQHVAASVANKKPSSQSLMPRADIHSPPPSEKHPIRTSALTRRTTSARPGSSGLQLSKEIGRRVSSIGGIFTSKEVKRHSSVITQADRERVGLPSRDTVTPIPTSSGAVSHNTDGLISQFPTPPNHQGEQVGFPAFAGTDPSSATTSPPTSGGATQPVSTLLPPPYQHNALLTLFKDVSNQAWDHVNMMITSHPTLRVELERLKAIFKHQQRTNIQEATENLKQNIADLNHAHRKEIYFLEKELAEMSAKYADYEVLKAFREGYIAGAAAGGVSESQVDENAEGIEDVYTPNA